MIQIKVSVWSSLDLFPQQFWLLIAEETQTGAATMGISVHVPQKPYKRSTICSTVPLLDIYPKEYLPPCRDARTAVFIAALFILARKWNQPQILSTDKCIINNGILLNHYNYKIIKFTSKYMDLESSYSKWYNPDPKKTNIKYYLLFVGVNVESIAVLCFIWNTHRGQWFYSF